jgi:hypothetical protein
MPNQKTLHDASLMSLRKPIIPVEGTGGVLERFFFLKILVAAQPR